MKYIFDKKYELTNEGISELMRDILKYSESQKMDKRELFRMTLSMEEYLVRWMENSSGESPVRLKIGTRYSKTDFSLSFKDKEISPFSEDDLEDNYILHKTNLVPTYYYKNNLNFLVFRIEKKKNYFLYSLVAAIVLGLVFGFLGRLFPASVLEPVSYVIEKLSDTVLGLMAMMAGPLIFFAVFTGITSIGDITKFSRIGKSTILDFLALDVIIMVLSGAVSAFLFPLKFSVSAEGDSFKSITDTVFGIFPGNIISPLYENNFLQLLLLSVIFAVAAILMRKQYPGIIIFAETMNTYISRIMSWFCSLIGIVVFATIVTNIWSDNFTAVFRVWKVFSFVIVLMILLFFILLVIVSVKKRIKIGELTKTVMPLIGVTILVGSSTTAIPEIIDKSTNYFKNEEFFSKFAGSLGIIFFTPDTILIFTSIVFYCTSVESVGVSASWLIIAGVMILLFSIAAPPVAGGYTALLGVIFVTLSIPNTTLTSIITIIVFLDYICTGFKVGCLLLDMAVQGEKAKKLDDKEKAET